MSHNPTARVHFALVATVLLLNALLSEPSFANTGLDTRVADLVERLEEKREEYHIPGMSIVVVHDGSVVLSRGFGVTNLDTNDPVTDETLFMIGSSTKAFTATLVAMMVDAGKIRWDEPIATYLPYFDPKVDSEDPDARITVRDALSHRSGFSRMSMLLTAQGMPPREVLEVAGTAEPYDGFRKAFHYNNIMFLASGTASATVAGTDWHKLLRKRIFKPLGLKSSSSISSKTKGTLHAGYTWDEDLAKHDAQPILPIDVAGPAGSIVSNANDMGRWLTFLLGRGEFDGNRLVTRASLEETWKTNITLTEGIDYGMGWFLREWEGRKVVEHGGSIHGFGAQVALIPEEGLGFALMTNLTATPLQQESLAIVWEALLGEPEAAARLADTTTADDLSKYLGDYVADFGPFHDATFAVTEKDAVLFVDVPGQTNYELKPPNEDGRRTFVVTDAISVSFEADEDGTIDMMRMQQGGLNFEIPRRGVEFPAEIDPAELAPYLGTYRSEIFHADVTVLILNNHLTIDVPGQMAFELHLPDENGRRRFRVRNVMAAKFDQAEDGSIASLTLHRGEEVVDTMPRIGDPDGEPLPTLDEIMAVRATDERRSAQAALVPVRIKGLVRFVNAGLVGTSVQWFDGKRVREDIDLGKFGWIHTAISSDHGETQSHVTPIDAIEGRYLRTAWQIQMVLQTLDWREDFEKIQVLKRSEHEGTQVVLIRIKNPDAPGITLYVDPSNGDVLRFDTSMPVPGANMEIPITVYLEDYREIDGIRIPFKTTTENAESGRTVVEVEMFEARVSVCDALFTLADDGDCE